MKGSRSRLPKPLYSLDRPKLLYGFQAALAAAEPKPWVGFFGASLTLDVSAIWTTGRLDRGDLIGIHKTLLSSLTP
jgi:hypothetical protein